MASIWATKVKEVVLFAELHEHEDFFYLDVPDEVIDAFIQMIPETGIMKPEFVSPPQGYVGAHISVIYPEEAKRLKRRVREIGCLYQYTIGKLFVTRPEHWET